MNLYNNDDQAVGAGLYRNDEWILAAKNGEDGAASLSAILDLKERDEVYLRRPAWVSDSTNYDKFYTNFSGFVMRVNM